MVKMIGAGQGPDLQEQLEQRKLATQQMELQLRIIAVENACKCAKPGEDPKTTLERVNALSGYLYTGLVNAPKKGS